MGLRNRILLLVALGLLIATASLGVMGLGMVRAATDRILEERLAMARTTAGHLDSQLAQAWAHLDRLAPRAGVAFRSGDIPTIRADLSDLVAQVPLFSSGVLLVDASGRVVAREGVPLSATEPVVRVASVRETLGRGQPQTGVMAWGPEQPALSLFSVPVFRTPTIVSGAIIGVVDLNTPALLTFINGLAMGRSGHAVIVSRDGPLWSSPGWTPHQCSAPSPSCGGPLPGSRRGTCTRKWKSATATRSGVGGE